MIALSFLRRFWREALICIAIFFAAHWFRQTVREAEARGRAEAMAAQAGALAAVYAVRADSADKAQVVRVDTLIRRRTVHDSILVHRTDTLLHRDTVLVWLERERTACDDALSSCDKAKAARDSVIAALRQQIAAKPKDTNGSFRSGALVGAGLTALAVWLAGGLAR